MPELTDAVAQKLDADLLRMWAGNVFHGESPIPVILRCATNQMHDLSSEIVSRRGKIRHQFPLLGAVSAWVPLGEIPDLAARDDVTALELEQQFTLA